MSYSSGFVGTPNTQKLIVLAQHGYHGDNSQFNGLFENLGNIDSGTYDCSSLILNRHVTVDKLPNLTKQITLFRTEFEHEAIGPISEQADDIRAIITTLREKYENVKIILLGHSKGGLVNMRCAINNPGYVDGLISIGTPYNFNIMGFVQGLLDDILLAAKNVGDFLGIDELEENLKDLYEKMNTTFVDDDLGNPEVAKALKKEWNALPIKDTPKLFTIGVSQLGKTDNYKGGGDFVVAASSQVANGYQKVYERYYVYDNYINLKLDRFLALINTGYLIQIITIIKQAVYYAKNDILEKVVRLLMSLITNSNDLPEYNLTHTRECNNLTVATFVDSILDTLSREENQDNSGFEPALNDY